MDQKVFIANELVRDSATSLLPYERAKQIKVIIGSWNVNASIEDISNLDTWIPPLDHSTGQRFDLIVIGLQEMIELSATNVVGSTVASMADERASKWQSLLLDYLQASSYCSDAINESAGSSGALGIRLVAACHLVGIWIGVFARESLLPDIRNVETGTVPCGAGGVLGNKGASCIRMDICDTSICFACAHLAANQNSVSKRNDDFNTIMSKGVFMDDKISSVLAIKSDSMQTMAATKVKTQLEGIRKQINKTEFSKNNYSNALSELSQKVPLGDHDLLFFFGDLNYRINENNRMLDDMYKIMQEDLELLKVDDQLNIERKSGRVFQGFAEGPLTFLPTYKFIAGTDEYDRRPEKKMRVPAWCDRILWRIGKSKHVSSAAVGSSSGSFEVSAQVDTELYTRDDDVPGSSRVVCNLIEQVEQLTYQRCDNIISDHRPIRSSFNVTVKRCLSVDSTRSN